MSLKRNILANFASQLYVTLIGIVLVPLYIRYMGAEAYGLVGFFAMLQAWFSLLDIGLTPTISRETARYRGGALAAHDYRNLLRILEWIFLATALVGAVLMLAGSHYIANDWLRASQLPEREVELAVQMMAVIIGMRWMSGLYRGVVIGSERLQWLSAFNAAIATVRSACVIPLLIYVGGQPSVFFGFQLVVAAIELVWLFLYTYRLVPHKMPGAVQGWDWVLLKPVLRFSLTIAFTSSVWVLVTQTDKLLLSRVLPLAEYGYFTLAVLVASGIMVITGPVSNAVMPRLATLEAQGAHAQLILVYRQATQIVAVIAGAASLTLAFFSQTLLIAWTGDEALAAQAAPVLSLYALGNGVLAMSAFPYYLQYAKGNLRLHLIGNLIFVVLLLPAIVWAATHHGAIGAGWVWVGMNLLSFVAWLPLVHRKFEPGLNRRWYTQDTVFIAAAGAGSAYLMSVLLPPSSQRFVQLLEVGVAAFVILLAGAAASSAARHRLAGWVAR